MKKFTFVVGLLSSLEFLKDITSSVVGRMAAGAQGTFGWAVPWFGAV
jgi:hypothetical protein